VKKAKGKKKGEQIMKKRQLIKSTYNSSEGGKKCKRIPQTKVPLLISVIPSSKTTAPQQKFQQQEKCASSCIEENATTTTTFPTRSEIRSKRYREGQEKLGELGEDRGRGRRSNRRY